mgnify:CR=1 FL=1
MTFEQTMDEVEAMEKEADGKDADFRDNMYVEVANKMADLDLSGLNQDQMLRFMNWSREAAWDIPSALMSLCMHPEMDEHFYMHRGTGEEHEKYTTWASLKEWEVADKHFKEEHGLDLKDTRINWSFDT